MGSQDAPIVEETDQPAWMSAPVVPEKEEKKGFLGRIGEDLLTREEKIQQSRRDLAMGKKTHIEHGLRMVGQPAWAALGVLGETVSAVTPEFIEEPIRRGVLAATKAAGRLPSAGGGTLGETIPGELRMMAEKYPRTANVLEDSAGLGILFAPVKGKPKAPKEPFFTLGKAGERAIAAGERQTLKTKKAFLADLVQEEATAAVKKAQILAGKRKEVGWRRRQQVVPDAFEVSMAKEVGKIKEVSRNKSLVKNIEHIQNEVRKTDARLVKALESKKIIFPKKEYKARIGKAIDELKEHPFLLSKDGNLMPTARKVIEEIEQIVKKSPATPAGLLQARRDFDRVIKKYKPKAFDADVENAFTTITKNLRTETNKFIAEKAPHANVKKALDKQHKLLTATENMAGKAAKLPEEALARLWKRTVGKLSLKGDIAALAATAGVAFTGTTPIALSAGGIYLGGKLLSGPQSKKILGKMLKATDKVIKESSKDAALLRQLRADRALLLQIYREQEGE